jgi:hypothetical protein
VSRPNATENPSSLSILPRWNHFFIVNIVLRALYHAVSHALRTLSIADLQS